MTFNYSPHPAQRKIHEARTARFRTVCTGRRFGKTLCLAAELLDRGGCESGGEYGWVAPTYNVAERGIEAFRAIAEGFVRIVGRMPTRVEFEGNAGPVKVWFLSADNPDNIRGYGFQGLVVDEAALITALQEERIAGAYLDALVTEPLPAGHPFWQLPNVLLVPHDSHSSPYIGDRMVALFCANLARYVAGEPLHHICNPKKGY